MSNTVNLRAIQGADRGRIYADMKLPLTIGREEGNAIQLNDERISRFHVKIQEDNSHVVLTDLDSTNGTRVNGQDCQLRILRFGDVIAVGRSVLIYGSRDEIASNVQDDLTSTGNAPGNVLGSSGGDFELSGSQHAMLKLQSKTIEPKIPERLSPSQAAQLSELLEFIHSHLGTIVDSVKSPENNKMTQIHPSQWQLLLQTYAKLSELIRSIAEPDL